jgi:hypothetical protein
MLSLGRQTVNELLQQLEQEKIIHCQHGGLRILDPSRPRDAAQAARKGAALQLDRGCSILPEEAAASNFVARTVWPDANDIEVAGSVRNKPCERRFPRRSGDETRMVVQCPCPSR